jgi:hypothetical protein
MGDHDAYLGLPYRNYSKVTWVFINLVEAQTAKELKAKKRYDRYEIANCFCR